MGIGSGIAYLLAGLAGAGKGYVAGKKANEEAFREDEELNLKKEEATQRLLKNQIDSFDKGLTGFDPVTKKPILAQGYAQPGEDYFSAKQRRAQDAKKPYEYDLNKKFDTSGGGYVPRPGQTLPLDLAKIAMENAQASSPEYVDNITGIINSSSGGAVDPNTGAATGAMSREAVKGMLSTKAGRSQIKDLIDYSAKAGERVATDNYRKGMLANSEKNAGFRGTEVRLKQDKEKREIEATAAAEKQKQATAAQKAISFRFAYNTANAVLAKIPDATSRLGKIGQTIEIAAGGFISDSETNQLEGALKTIRANVGIGALQDMRNSNKTGAGMGQISDKETELLQATITTLNLPKLGFRGVRKNLAFMNLILGGVPDESGRYVSIIDRPDLVPPEFAGLMTQAAPAASTRGTKGPGKQLVSPKTQAAINALPQAPAAQKSLSAPVMTKKQIDRMNELRAKHGTK